MKEIVIRRSFKKQLNLTFMATLMVLLSFFVFLMAPEIAHSNTFISLIMAVGFVGVIFFSICLIYIIYGLLKSKDILKIDKNGFLEKSSFISGSYILWADVKSIVGYTSMGQKYIGVELKDSEKFLKSLPIIKRVLLKLNLKLGYPTILINLNSSKVDYSETLSSMAKFFDMWKLKDK
ncbi:hypothetical protein SAMN02745245_00440 [Anaerosphaera aminiphila DSM 21120]|uniref:PH domain-containing protein n=1 Tax=Anaerosphaera aminiphila DSM 21120 TaxID=1120995 RepID=A0A1M5PSB2_9FIRM|nr:STM3941 family protein [Anaerosphaera aminiphila]SHH04399.1 hypothetical protein SAMN02745245_00440 [Anaerosphaera aminiphila DSM 21120]